MDLSANLFFTCTQTDSTTSAPSSCSGYSTVSYYEPHRQPSPRFFSQSWSASYQRRRLVDRSSGYPGCSRSLRGVGFGTEIGKSAGGTTLLRCSFDVFGRWCYCRARVRVVIVAGGGRVVTSRKAYSTAIWLNSSTIPSKWCYLMASSATFCCCCQSLSAGHASLSVPKSCAAVKVVASSYHYTAELQSSCDYCRFSSTLTSLISPY